MKRALRLGGSSAHRWLKCWASVALPPADGWTNESSPAAELGTQMHKMLEDAINSEDRSMATDEGVRECYDYVVNRAGEDGTVETEHPLAYWLSSKVRMGGTCDVLITKPGGWAELIDYKNGIYPVSERAEQLLVYGMLLRIQFPDIKKLTVTIVQPNEMGGGSPIKSRVLPKTETDALKREVDELVARGDMTEKPGDHCKFCPRMLCCDGYLHEQTDNIVKASTIQTNGGGLEGMTGDEFGQFVTECDDLKKFVEDVRNLAKRRLEKNPESVPGWSLGTRKAAEKYVVEKQEPLLIGLAKRLAKAHSERDEEQAHRCISAMKLATPTVFRNALAGTEMDFDKYLYRPDEPSLILKRNR